MTLKEIAAQAGVSVSTVSRVINGKAQNAAGRELQDRIWEIARAGGYVPNLTAQALKTGAGIRSRTRSIACIYTRFETPQNDAFFSALTRAMEREALQNGYVVRYSFSAFHLKDPVTQQLVANNYVDGVAVLGRCTKEVLKYVKEHFNKVIYTGLNPLHADYDQILCDGSAAAQDMMQYLYSLGHRCIAYLGETHNEARFRAYQQFLNARRLRFGHNIIADAFASSEGGYQGALKILENSTSVTAFFCMNDVTAIGALKAIHEKGLRVPQDISVISMDDIETAQFVSPMLTTVHIPIEEMGAMTAKMLIDRISGGHRLPLKLILPYHLVRRESCGPARKESRPRNPND